MKLYMAVTRDEYELPYAVEQSPSELARAIGVKANTVVKAIGSGKPGYVAVEVDVDEDELMPQRYCQACGQALGNNAHPQKRFCDTCKKERIKDSVRRSKMRFCNRTRW